MAGPRIYFPTWIDSLVGYAWQGGVGVVWTTDGGVSWNVSTSGVSIGYYGIVTITIDGSGVYVTDGLVGVLHLTLYQWKRAEGDFMAFTQPGEYSFTVLDELGTKASTVFRVMVDPTKTVANLVTDLNSMATALDGTTDAQIVGERFTLVGAPTEGIKDAPAAGSRVEQTAVINLGVAENTRRWGVDVPGIADSAITGGRITLTGSMETLTKLLDNTTALVSSKAANAAFQVIDKAIDYVLSFRQRRKQLGRTSYELIPGADA